MKNKKGFTLIELLIVIGIIGILSAIVVASLNDSRNKSSDAVVKTDLVNIRTQAALYFDRNINFGIPQNGCTANIGSLFADTTVQAQITQADKENSSSGNVVCITTPTSFAVAAVLKTDTTKAYCVDANNAGKVFSGLATAGDASSAVSASATCN